MCLGICSALAVSNKVENAIAMGAGVTFVLIATAVMVSSLRKMIPARGRMITYMVTIASFVIVVDKFLKAYFPVISETMGPYVGLIITNCILMGRAEAFYARNPLGLSLVDAVANGIAYSYTLTGIAVVREVLGFGTLLGMRVMPAGWENWVVLSLAPGAFFLLGLFLWITRTLAGVEPPREG
ncbi:MAG: NADH:ubiquinone reductase (Na(+)-transporting) subunit D [Lentisphaerae bacterium]|nr:NADH:ubiquinone reductase (Na(+)-transporting) subunit D [Lentisphaerota bacterium]